MRVIYILLAFLPLTFSIFSCSQGTAGEQRQHDSGLSSEAISESIVEVYYFHFTRRCISCIAVQDATEKVLEENYSEEIKNGKMAYYEVNLSEPGSHEIARMLGVGGQALLVVYGNKKYDLTMQGFMFAFRDYNRFKETLDTAISRVKT